jgi:hypothetical protein
MVSELSVAVDAVVKLYPYVTAELAVRVLETDQVGLTMPPALNRTELLVPVSTGRPALPVTSWEVYVPLVEVLVRPVTWTETRAPPLNHWEENE